MREEISSECRVKSVKFADQNQGPKGNNAKGNSHSSKPRSSWGSHIVKGFSGEKKAKSQTTVQSKKFPLTNSDAANQKNALALSQARVKRSLIGDLSCSVTSSQVHPQGIQTQRTKSSGSQDLFFELDHLRSLLQESKEREVKLQAELSECKRNPKILELEREIDLKKSGIDTLVQKVNSLESEKTSLLEQLFSLSTVLERQEDVSRREGHESMAPPSRNFEIEVVELRRLNKELQLENRNLICRLSSVESQLATQTKNSKGDSVEKIKEEVSLLRHANEDLSKQVEGLQMSRLNEVEELVYLRWVNSCLRNELHNCSTTNSDRISSPSSIEESCKSIDFPSSRADETSELTGIKRIHLIKKLKKWPITDEDLQNLECPDKFLDHSWIEALSPRRRHSISGSKCSTEELLLNKRRQSDGVICSQEMEKDTERLVTPKYDSVLDLRPRLFSNCQETGKVLSSLDIEKRSLRIPNPPPRPSCAMPSGQIESSAQIPPPPPPPPPPLPPPKFTGRNTAGVVQRAPQVVEFYHSLMKRDSRKDSLNGGGTCDASDVANVRSSMIGEIENRSSHLLAIKADVETQGEFVNFLIREVNNAVYQDIEDVVAFVKWLDDELCFLVDERAVLKHFEWPEKKADTLREAAFGYRDLKKLEREVTNYKDDSQLSCDIALKKMVALSEKMERTVYNLLRTRDSLMRHCKEFKIPTDWMLDDGILSKIKFGSVQLAKQYMKRVAMELQTEKDSSMDYMLLQGVRFAFRIHQFAGGFDAETMQTFEELRNLAVVLNKM